MKIKAFYGNSENAEYTQIWIAVYKYLLLAIAKKRWQVEESLFAPESVADFVRNSQQGNFLVISMIITKFDSNTFGKYTWDKVNIFHRNVSCHII